MFGFEVSLVVWTSLVVLFSIGYYLYMTWPYNYFKKRGIPGPKPVPFLGNVTVMGKQPIWMNYANWIKEYGKVFGLFTFGKRTLMVSDREMLREIFIKDFDNFCDRPTVENRGMMKDGLILTKGQHWRNLRHHLSPYFSSGTMKMSTDAINNILDNLVGWLEEKCKQEEMLEAKTFCQLMTLDIICSTAFGVEVNSCKYPDVELLKKAMELFKSMSTENKLNVLSSMFPKLGKLLGFFGLQPVDWSYLAEFTGQLIEQRTELTEKGGHDFINILLKQRKGSEKGLSDKEIAANAVLFLLAGYETTAGSLAFLLYNLAVYPEYQEKVVHEIQEVIGNEKPTYDTVQHLKYLGMCLDESLRLYPLLPRVDRLCVKDTVVKGLAIEKGVSVAMPIWYLHRDPEIWKDPEVFDPNRFTPEKKKAMDSINYVPFGLGPRHCIGMRLALLEIKMAVVRILQKFKIGRNEKTQVPLEFDVSVPRVQAKHGIWISLENRS